MNIKHTCISSGKSNYLTDEYRVRSFQGRKLGLAYLVLYVRNINIKHSRTSSGKPNMYIVLDQVGHGRPAPKINE